MIGLVSDGLYIHKLLSNIQDICFDMLNTLVSVGRVPQLVGPMTAEVLRLDAKNVVGPVS